MGRTHINRVFASLIVQHDLKNMLKSRDSNREIVIVCIGTDRSTGDSLGPLVGYKLKAFGFKKYKVFGTLENPVHAINLKETIDEINSEYKNPFVIAIDACLGRPESVGTIDIKAGALKPGSGVNKDLPAIGDLNIMGIVNIAGCMEATVLQCTRLNLVMKMADIISRAIFLELNTKVKGENK
jgi:putative sporulation protein YyaC